MSRRSRIILAVSALSLILMYFFPIWKISLDAPQYPEGIGLEIWVDTVKGQKKHDLANVNNLNHYIGMKRIEPDSIPELEIMPWIIGFLIVSGLLAAWGGKRWMMYLWVGLFAAIAAVGIYDFYLWEYDYGHNLDQEHAIIKIPGMSYQPPLLGSKQLLNFVATSWPAIGGIIAILSMAVVLWLSFKEFRQGVKIDARSMSPAFLMLLLPVILIASCRPAPRAIEVGEDRCEHCLMGISDGRYGGEIVLTTGKVLVFDSVECLASYLVEHEVAPHSLWVADYERPGVLIPAESAVYARSEAFHSPMGFNFAAFEGGVAVGNGMNLEVFDWNEVLDFFQQQAVMAHGHPVERQTITASQ